MQTRILALAILAITLQSCSDSERADNTEVTGNEAGAPEYNNGAAALTNNDTTGNYDASDPKNEAYNAGSTTPGTATVNTESSNTPGFKASYQVPGEAHASEKRKISERERTSAQQKAKTVKLKQGNMTGTYDEPGDDYKGEDVRSHDGVDKNIKRNTNYQDFSGSKVPNDGGDFNK